MKSLKISVIIPFKEVNSYVRKCVQETKKLDYRDYDIILLPDHEITGFPGCRVIPTGPIYPAQKRNMAAKATHSQLLAFIDSDAYPRKDWLAKAVPFFDDPSVAAVGGPNLVPPEAGQLEHLSADVVYSSMCTGSNYPIKRYKAPGTWEYKEIAASNLIVRKSDFDRLKGFDTTHLTSEDSKLCFQIRTRLKKKVVRSDDIIVWHHRRPLFWPHFRRMFVEGRNKARVFWQIRSMKFWTYLLPSLFLVGLFVGFILSFVHPLFLYAYLAVLAFYFCWAVVEAIRIARLRAVFFPLSVFGTHVMYGAGFIFGSLTP